MAEINLNDLNVMATQQPEKMIMDAEAEYEVKVQRVAKRIIEDENIRLLLLAGPSGSGKTTTANLISDEIKKMGEESFVISLDDFYRDHDDPDYPKLENGERDYECLEALNLKKLSSQLESIVNGRAFTIPKYDFKVGKCISERTYPDASHACIIIEGLHALNPLISESLPKEKILKLFVSVSTNVNHDGERILSGRKMRFIRRLVRDNIYRGASVERTLSMWKGVLLAEDIYLYPYKNTADIAFNTFHTFELGVMKSRAIDLIPRTLVSKSDYLGVVRSALELITPIDSEKIPRTSLIREFLPGGIYESLY